MNLLGRGNPEDIPDANYTIKVNGMTVFVPNPSSLVFGTAAKIGVAPESEIPPGSCTTVSRIRFPYGGED